MDFDGREHDQFFPTRLHYFLDMLEEDGLSCIVSFQPHGRAFLVRDQKRFVKELLPKWFRQNRWASFQRQLNIYQFKRITDGPDKGSYYHPCFLKGHRDLCRFIKRIKIKGTGPRKPSCPESEPDFYSYPPLPPILVLSDEDIPSSKQDSTLLSSPMTPTTTTALMMKASGEQGSGILKKKVLKPDVSSSWAESALLLKTPQATSTAPHDPMLPLVSRTTPTSAAPPQSVSLMGTPKTSSATSAKAATSTLYPPSSGISLLTTLSEVIQTEAIKKNKIFLEQMQLQQQHLALTKQTSSTTTGAVAAAAALNLASMAGAASNTDTIQNMHHQGRGSGRGIVLQRPSSLAIPTLPNDATCTTSSFSRIALRRRPLIYHHHHYGQHPCRPRDVSDTFTTTDQMTFTEALLREHFL